MLLNLHYLIALWPVGSDNCTASNYFEVQTLLQLLKFVTRNKSRAQQHQS